MSMKVCKLVRLTQKKSGKNVFDPSAKEGRITVRSKVVVSEEDVKTSEENCETTGLLYIVDEKATKERDAVVAAENKGEEPTETKEATL